MSSTHARVTDENVCPTTQARIPARPVDSRRPPHRGESHLPERHLKPPLPSVLRPRPPQPRVANSLPLGLVPKVELRLLRQVALVVERDDLLPRCEELFQL